MTTFPPTVDTAAGLDPNAEASVDTRAAALRATETALFATQQALAAGTGVKKTYKFVYDFAVLGGAVSTITLTAPDGALPNNFVIQNAFLDILTVLTSAGAAQAAVATGQGAGDLVAAAVISGAPYSSTGVKVTIPLLGTIATWIKTTAARSPTLAVTVAALTAGKFNLFIEGYVSA